MRILFRLLLGCVFSSAMTGCTVTFAEYYTGPAAVTLNTGEGLVTWELAPIPLEVLDESVRDEPYNPLRAAWRREQISGAVYRRSVSGSEPIGRVELLFAAPELGDASAHFEVFVDLPPSAGAFATLHPGGNTTISGWSTSPGDWSDPWDPEGLSGAGRFGMDWEEFWSLSVEFDFDETGFVRGKRSWQTPCTGDCGEPWGP